MRVESGITTSSGPTSSPFRRQGRESAAALRSTFGLISGRDMVLRMELSVREAGEASSSSRELGALALGLLALGLGALALPPKSPLRAAAAFAFASAPGPWACEGEGVGPEGPSLEKACE